jgi:hypothetical protein
VAAAPLYIALLISAPYQLPDDELDAFVESNLAQPALRAARVLSLTAAARPFSYNDAHVVLRIGDALSTSVE